MQRILYTVALSVLLAHIAVTGYQFEKCNLARTLVQLDVPKTELFHWICMADHESNRTINNVRSNKDGSSAYGVFGINSRYNCNPRDGRRTNNRCNMDCNSFLDGNLADDVACVKRLYAIQRNFLFSDAYHQNCGKVNSVYLRGCYIP